jgi:hypothetical protein
MVTIIRPGSTTASKVIRTDGVPQEIVFAP